VSVVMASKEELLNELSQALVERAQCQEAVFVDEERLTLSRGRLSAAHARVFQAQEAITKACEPETRVSETMGELYKRHGLR
jgi:hypothetical protein